MPKYEAFETGEIGIRYNVSAAELTTFKGGGSVEVLYEPYAEEAFVKLIKALREDGRKPFILGNGSNVIISDGTVDRPVVSTAGLTSTRFDGEYVSAGAGVKLPSLIASARRNGLGGLEFLCGVPCSVGGAVRMNAGAFGAQIGDYVTQISVLKCDCGIKETIACTESVRAETFGYRRGVKDVVLGATFRLLNTDAARSEELGKSYLAQRAYKQPKYPSCGSVFKNPSKPAGLLIEQCGLKGARHGGAQISELHGNFIINLGGASADDFLSLAELCESAVYDKFGMRLQREFEVL